jgi:putative ubiquitin-RnfH superfamily antitoxin RatB of RatAB toxin-antitoxin module
MLRISVAIALEHRQDVVELELPEGSRVADALQAAQVRERLRGIEAGVLDTGIWSKRCARDTPLRDGDRVEVYRPLAADPKAMRRERARLRPSTRSRSGR